ncbi:MAG: hypothetical protein SVM86_05915, partial [Candidatus Cloacimonadota bacterium]|nr:hypothetical protein [Candidatus Cloacimonadota bacterium]
MRILWGVFIFAFLFLSLACDVPNWVKQFRDGKNIESFQYYYWGIGVSDVSSLKADNNALQQFSRNIETTVKSKIKNRIAEAQGKVS